MATSNGPTTLDLAVMPAPQRVLAAIRAALEAEVRPAVSTDAGIAALREIDTLLGYLAAREEPGRDLRERAFRDGQALLAEGRHLLSGAGGPALADGVTVATCPPPDRAGQDWPGARDIEALLIRLAGLTSALTSARPLDSGHAARVSALARRVAAWESDWYESVEKLARGEATGPAIPSSATAGAGQARHPGRPAERPKPGEMTLAGLNAFLPDLLPGYPGGGSLTAISGSSGKRTYKLALKHAWEGHRLLIIRQEPPGLVPSWVTTDLHSEAMIVRVVGAAGVPVPRLLAVVAEPTELGAPFAVLEERAGIALGSPYGDGEMPAASAEMAAALLAAVHRVPVADLSAARVRGFEPELTGLSRADLNARYLAELTGLWEEHAGRVASPTIERVLSWLRRNLVPDDRPCTVVHGDFGPHNMLAVDGEITALLDWEYAKPGDPAQDLGYAQEAMSRHLDWAQFIKAYRQAGGAEVSAASIQWTGAASWLRNAMVAMTRIASFNDGSRWDVATPGRIRSLPRILTKMSGQIEPLPRPEAL